MCAVKAELTPIEQEILEYLEQSAGEIVSYEDIYRKVWEAEPFRCEKVVAVHVCHLRQKMEEPERITAHRKQGYCFS